MIPRIFHRTWFGPNPLPPAYVGYGESFRRFNPGWEMMLWTDEHVPLLVNQALFDNAIDGCEKSDLVRHEVLYQFGGVFIDTDVECLRSFEPLRPSPFCGIQDYLGTFDRPRYCPAVIGAECGSRTMYEVIKKFPLSFSQYPHDRIKRCFGPFNECPTLPHEFTVYTPEYFYPYHYTEKHRRNESFPHSFAVHHWAGGWA